MEEIGIGIFLMMLFFIYCAVTSIIIGSVVGILADIVDYEALITFGMVVGVIAGIIGVIVSFFFYEVSFLASLGIGLGSSFIVFLLLSHIHFIIPFVIFGLCGAFAVFIMQYFGLMKDDDILVFFVCSFMVIIMILIITRD